jgi:hypothetical protein
MIFLFRFCIIGTWQQDTFLCVASGCQETLRSKFPLKQPPRLFFDAPILLLTAACSNYLMKHQYPTHARVGNPAPILALPLRVCFVIEHIFMQTETSAAK